MCIHMQQLALKHCCSISTGSYWNILLTTLISLWVTAICLPTRRTNLDHIALTMSCWKIPECSWAHRQQISWAQAYGNLFSYTSASILAVTRLRNSVSMYKFIVYSNFFFPMLTHQRSPSEYPSYFSLLFFSFYFETNLPTSIS